jgi:glycosyltransferase involved in cell wall biosynthesis
VAAESANADSVATPSRPIASIVIPAHDEEASIGRCLGALTARAGRDEFEIAVVCNGCSDASAKVARDAWPSAQVVEVSEANKSQALNLGDSLVTTFPKMYVDADIELSTEAARALVESLRDPAWLAATTGQRFELASSTAIIRRYYRAQLRTRYPKHLVGQGVIALSKEGRERFGEFPPLIADDLFLQSLFKPEEYVVVESHAVTVRAPRTLRDWLYTQTRVSAGNIEYRRKYGPNAYPSGVKMVIQANRSPLHWGDLGVYVSLTLVGHLNGQRRLRSRSGVGWRTIR